MNRFSSSLVLLLTMAAPGAGAAQDARPLPWPLGLADVIRIAGERRDEIQPAGARESR